MYKHFKSPFAVGDRVLVTKGKDTAKVGTIAEVQPDTGFVRMQDLRKVSRPKNFRHFFHQC
jgi:large subunit ribosomal protein L24